MTDRKLRVFLCHSSNDKPAVRELYQRLKAEGWIDPWLDEEKLYPGQDWDLEIEKAVEASDAVIVFLSNNSVSKEGYIQRELRFVLRIADFKPEGTVFVIPVRLEDCPLPRRLSMWQYVDYFPEKRKDWAYKRLLGSLKVRAGKLDIATINPAEEQFRHEAQEIANDKENERAHLTFEQKAKKSRQEYEKKVYKEKEILEESAVVKNIQPSKSIETISLTPTRLRPIEPVKHTPGGHPIYIIGDVEVVKVPAGKFLMGSSDSDKQARAEEKPQHSIEIPYEYYIGRFPITNEQFAKFVKAGAKHPVGDWQQRHDHPVVKVSWGDAMAYCQWLNDYKKEGILPDLIFRLPTEAEWEKAARGIDGRLWPWGNTFYANRCNSSSNDFLGFRKDFGLHTTSVGYFSPQGDSPFGVADAVGNVWEWTHSLKKGYPYSAEDGRENKKSLGNRVLRGGSYNYNKQFARCAFRFSNVLFFIKPGFRVALAPKLP